jgi:PIN domain nuclease of toxin-antitoxin system
MNLLLDTHAFLWWLTDNPKLPAKTRDAIAYGDAVYISAASAWEVAIKIGLGRLTVKDPFARLVVDSGFDELPITFSHAEEVKTLPPHHRDPFDRMLVAQARVEGLALVTDDQLIAPYSVTRLWD